MFENNGSSTPSTSNQVAEPVSDGCDDFGDDEFGDFEAASATNVPPEDAPSGVSQLNIDSRRNSKALNVVPLPDVIEQLNLQDLQKLDAASDQSESESTCICDLFGIFSICDSNSISGNEGVNLRSLELWSKLCNVEETNALNFQWNGSMAYLNFLNALRINNGDRSGLRPEFSASSAVAASMSCNSASAMSNNSELIDSLSVPPASFDWQTSGLSNPLTGSSMPTVHAVLACDFFNGESSSGYNSESLLKRDLDAFGLGDDSPSNLKSQLSVNVQELIEKSSSSRGGSSNTSPLAFASHSTLEESKIHLRNGFISAESNNNVDLDDHSIESNHSGMSTTIGGHYSRIVGSRLASSAAMVDK